MTDIVSYVSHLPSVPYSYTFQQEDGTTLTLSTHYVIEDIDRNVIDLWLHRSESVETRAAYASDIDQFYQFLLRDGITSIRDVWPRQMTDYAEYLIREKYKPASRARKLAAVKSLLTYANKADTVAFPRNAGTLLKLPKPPDELAQRILPEEAIKDMIATEKDQRNHAILATLYYCGLRAHELCHLRWKQLIPRQGDHQFGGILNVHGKGNVTRTIPVKHIVWDELQALRPDVCSDEDYVFTSVSNRNAGKHLTTESIRLIVQNAAYRVGVKSKVSPHWMRHGHATYAQAHGASPVLVKETLGHKSLQTTTRYSHIINGDGSGRYL